MAFGTMAREASRLSRRGFVAGAGLATGALAVASTGMAFADEAGEGVGRAAVGEAIGKNGHMNVQVVMEKFGGGGHRTMAAAQIEDSSIEEVLEKLKKEIDNYFADV